MSRLLIVDGSNVFYRSYFGLKDHLSYKGNPTWAIHGCLNTIADMARHHRPTHMVVAFDEGKSEYRLAISADYKGTRDQHDDGAHFQVDWTKRILTQFGICTWSEDGIEGDDIIATVVERFKPAVDGIILISGDKDMRQMVDANVILYHPSLGGTNEKCWNVDLIQQRYGVHPRQLPEIFALSGDKVDNVPGVAGIGELTAIKLIQKHGDLAMLMLSDEPKIQGRNDDVKISLDLVLANPYLSAFQLGLDDIGYNPVIPGDASAWVLRESLEFLGLESIMSRWTSGTLWKDRGRRLSDT